MSLPEITTLEELRNREIPARVWHWEDGLTPGLNLLIAKKRQGKSWFSLWLALAISLGQEFLSRPTTPGRVLYINTELDETASHERSLRLPPPLPDNLLVCHTWRKGELALADLEEVIVEQHLDVVVIDMLIGILAPEFVVNDYMQSDYWNRVRKIGQRHGVSILGLWHAGKAERLDFVDGAIGSTGLVGQADSIIGLAKKGKNQVSLQMTGNHGHDTVLPLRFTDCRWELSSEEGQETLLGLKGAALKCSRLVSEQPGLTCSDIARSVGLDAEKTVRSALRRMVNQGQMKKEEQRYYPVNRSNTGQTG